MSDPEIRIVRILPASPEEVFDAWVDPEAMGTWMCPGDIIESKVELDLRVGGRFHINMRNPRGDDHHRGRYVEIERPTLLVFTWASDGTGGRDTLVRIEIRPHGEGESELVLTHERLAPEQRPPHRTGWKAHLRELRIYLAR